VWNLHIRGTRTYSGTKTTTSDDIIKARVVINCAGNYGDVLEVINKQPKFKITPRKGQFVVYKAAVGARNIDVCNKVLTHIILPVPTERTKGILVSPTVLGAIASTPSSPYSPKSLAIPNAPGHALVLVGPTAEEQQDRRHASVAIKVVHNLRAKGVALFPPLATYDVTNCYAGLRPASQVCPSTCTNYALHFNSIQFKDYQIEVTTKKNWITVAGIRSTGLSAAVCIIIAR
jgi:glycerol-3-phosphate dehydrogenase